MNILIPMAGEGSRFTSAGYPHPKPLINVNGKPMIQRVIESIGIQGRYIFVIREYHDSEYTNWLEEIIKECCNDYIIHKVNYLTEGAACTCLLAKEEIDNNQPLIITNCDQIFHWNPNNFLDSIKYCDGSVITYQSDDLKNSFVKTDINNNAIEFAEKEPISNNALIGFHYWARGNDFVRSANQMINDENFVKGEYYVAPTYNYLIAENKLINTYNIDENAIRLIGVPADLDQYIDDQRSIKKAILFDLDGVLIDTKSIQIEATYQAIKKFYTFEFDIEDISDDVTTIDKLQRLVKKDLIFENDIQPIYREKKRIANKLVADLSSKNFDNKQKLFRDLWINKIPFAVVTNANRQWATTILKKMDSLKYCRVLISNQDTINHKPHAEPYFRAMSMLGVGIDDCIILEDSETGLEAARNTGSRYIKVNSPNEVTSKFVLELL